MPLHSRIARIAVPAVLAACIAIEVLRGGDSLPTWIANLSVKTGLGPDRMLRLLIAAEAAGAVLAAASAWLARPVAWACAVGFAFSALAEFSAIVNAPGAVAVPASAWAGPLAGLAVGATLLAVLSKPAQPKPARPGHWTAIAAVAVAGAAVAVSARVPLTQRSAGDIGVDGVPTVMLNPQDWVGMSAPQTGVSRHLPLLTPLTLSGTKWVVFYSPDCGRCHQVFKAYFKGPQGGDVIAVRVPPAPGIERIENEALGDVECEGCERLSLPEGTRWVITTPAIVRFQDGAVDCVTSADYSKCRRGSEELP